MSINLSHLKKLIATMIPILIAQVSTVGMNFMDSTMSGHVSANDLAGVSIGASLFLPIQTTAMGLLTAATPMAAQLMGKKEKESIPMIIRTGLYLALLLSFLFALLYYLLIDTVLEGLSLAPAVSSIAKDYMLALVGAFLFEMLAMPLRSLTDTVGATTISMRLFLLALPVNGLLNYAFIFGKWGAPAMGGVGAGIATLLTYVFLVLLFLAVILSHKPFMGRARCLHGNEPLRLHHRIHHEIRHRNHRGASGGAQFLRYHLHDPHELLHGDDHPRRLRGRSPPL